MISGVNMNFCIVNGWTALHWAAFCGRDWHKHVQALLSDKEEFEKDLKRLNDKLTSASLTIMLKVSC
ncbi:hypothetical protein AHAS_Ahas15G0222800 [Arachis hypogaea]